MIMTNRKQLYIVLAIAIVLLSTLGGGIFLVLQKRSHTETQNTATQEIPKNNQSKPTETSDNIKKTLDKINTIEDDIDKDIKQLENLINDQQINLDY